MFAISSPGPSRSLRLQVPLAWEDQAESVAAAAVGLEPELVVLAVAVSVPPASSE